MASSPRIDPTIALQIDRLATAVAKDPRSKEFVPLADEYIKAGMWQEAAAVLEDGLKAYPGFVTAMAALGRVYDQLGQPVKAKAILEEVVKQRPDNLRGHRILAKLYQGEGKADLALRSCAVILGANRSITGNPDEHQQSKRDKKRIGRETTAAPVKQSVPPVTMSASSTPVSTLSPEATPEPPSMKHAATIARLEAWLRTIQSHRETDSHRI